MIIKEKDGVKYCVFESFEKTGLVSHCFSTRVGGVSEGVFDSLNVSYTRGDKKENVDENIKRLSNAAGFNADNIIGNHQIHETEILKVDTVEDGCDITGYDGFVTDKKNITLCTYHADCVPIFLLDPVKEVIGLCHAGWRGTVKKIAAVTAEKMHDLYGCEFENIIAGIGPSIGKCCFQVGKEVRDEFLEKIPASEKFIDIDKSEDGKYKIDLWSVNKTVLVDVGLKPDNIEVTDACTKCNPELFYSHRNMGTNRGSMAAYLMLREF